MPHVRPENPRDSKMSIDAFSARLARLSPSHTGFESRLCPSRLAPVRLSRLPRPRPVREKCVCAVLRLSSHFWPPPSASLAAKLAKLGVAATLNLGTSCSKSSTLANSSAFATAGCISSSRKLDTSRFELQCLIHLYEPMYTNVRVHIEQQQQ